VRGASCLERATVKVRDALVLSFVLLLEASKHVTASNIINARNIIRHSDTSHQAPYRDQSHVYCLSGRMHALSEPLHTSI